MKSLLTHWSGKAAVPDAAYRLVRDFRSTVERRTFQVWVAPAQSAAPDFQFRIPASFEGPLWRLVSDRPAHLLPPGYETWPAFLLQAADEAAANLTRECGDLASCTWGRRNTVRISHPLGALPVLGSLLNMPVVSLPGDDDMPRVQGRGYGASERFAVSPGHESEGYFEMPGGQSGHPLSPFYRAGHEAWVNGTRESFLPGPAAHTLLLTPQQEQLPTTRPANPSSVQGAGG
jgi:penicillin amidase